MDVHLSSVPPLSAVASFTYLIRALRAGDRDLVAESVGELASIGVLVSLDESPGVASWPPPDMLEWTPGHDVNDESPPTSAGRLSDRFGREEGTTPRRGLG